MSTLESLYIRDYRLLWLGQVSTSMGQWMDQVTRGYLMYQLTGGNAFDVGAVTAARGLPILLFGIIAGALADRSGRKAQLVIAQVTNAILNALLATLVITGLVQPWHVYVTAFLAGTVQAFQQPARQTLVSDIVGNDKLMNALALNSAALNGSRVLGPGISGALIVFLGVSKSYYLQAVMYLIATIWTLQMVVPEPHSDRADRGRESFWASISSGLVYVAKQKNIRAQLILALGPLTFGMSYTAMMPIIALTVLHGTAQTQGLLLSCIGVGALSGALIVASMKRDYAYGLTVVIGAIAFCIGVFMFASSHWIWLSCILGAILGTFSVTYTTQDQTLLQVSAPRNIRGRVMSIFLLNRGTVPIGALLAGTLAQLYGGQNSLHIMAVLGLLTIGLVVATNPGILTLKVPLKTDEDAERDRAASTAPPVTAERATG